MTEPFMSQITLMAFNWAPSGWAQCDGQILNISQNPALYSLIGTYFGGDGTTTFALPDLRGRVPIHTGDGHGIGNSGGEQTHMLTTTELPAHTHVMNGSNTTGETSNPTGAYLGQTANAYNSTGTLVTLAPAEIGNPGGSQAHLNLQPYATVNFCIALQGVYPSRG